MVRTIQFEDRVVQVPDDATDAEVQNVLSAASEPPASAAPSPPSLVDRIMSGANYAAGTVAHGLRGAREGAANVLGLPVDIVNNSPRLANILPGVDGVGPISEKPFLGSAFIDSALGGFGALPEPPAPDGLVQRGTRRVGQEIGASAIPVGAGLSLGARGVAAARELPGIARLFAEPAAIDAAQFVGRQAKGAVAAGLGAAGANEAGRLAGVDPNSAKGQVIDLIGAIFGAGVTGAGGSIGRGLKQVVDAVRQNPNYLDRVVNDTVVDRIVKASGLPETTNGAVDTTSLVDAIMRPGVTTPDQVRPVTGTGARRPSEVIPGYVETLADRTQNPGIAALEYGRQQGENAGQFIQRRSQNTEAVDRAMTALEPQATPGAFRNELEVQRASRIADAGMGRLRAEAEAAAAVRGLTPTTTPQQRGGTVRTALEDAREVARRRTEDAYAAANVAGKPVDPSPLTQSLDEAVAGLTQTERGLVPQGALDRVAALGRQGLDGPSPTGLLDATGMPITRPAPPPEPIRLKEATDLKSELQRLQRAALADPRAEKGGRNAARVLGQMIDTVDGFISSNLSPDELGALNTARGTKFSEAEHFGRQGDPIAEALARRDGGVPRIADDQVAGRFVNTPAMDRLFAEANTPAVRAAIREEVLSRGDMTTTDRIAGFKAVYGEQLRRFPGLADEIDAAAAARLREADAIGRETGLQRDLGTDGLPGRGTVGRYLQYSDANAERAISEVLAAKDPGRAADELLTFVGDSPQAVEGARAAFWQKLRTESTSVDNAQRSMSGKRAWRGDWLKGWLEKPATAAVAERLYRGNPQHLENIREIAAVLDNADLRVRGKATGTSGTGQGASNILTPETLQSRWYAYMRGQVSGTYLATSIAAVIARRAVRGARTEAIERVTDKALLDPEFAAMLLRENNPANRAALARRAPGWFGNEASTIVNLANEPDDDHADGARDGLMDAIMRDR